MKILSTISYKDLVPVMDNPTVQIDLPCEAVFALVPGEPVLTHGKIQRAQYPVVSDGVHAYLIPKEVCQEANQIFNLAENPGLLFAWVLLQPANLIFIK